MMKDNEQLLEILRQSLWGGAKQSEDIPERIRAELCNQTVEGLTAIAYQDTQNLKYAQAAMFARMAHMQAEAVHQLQHVNIPVVVIKGTAAGIYYPWPQLRAYGDIDLMVQPEHYCDAIEVLRDGGWHQLGDIESHQTRFRKNDELLELHQCKCEPKADRESRYINQFLLSGFSDIQERIIDQAKCSFPMLPWQQNGLELIWHIKVHLYNGIGLRHVIDWMMFVYSCLDDNAFRQLKPILDQAGLLTLAKTVTKMCQIYLGLPANNITWCSEVAPSLCACLMDYIFEQGNFGQKRSDDKAAKVLTRYRRPSEFLTAMQKKGLREWAAAKKHTVLKPFAWLYIGVEGVKLFLTPDGRKKLRQARTESNQRNELFEQLYGDKSK